MVPPWNAVTHRKMVALRALGIERKKEETLDSDALNESRIINHLLQAAPARGTCPTSSPKAVLFRRRMPLGMQMGVGL